MNFDGLTDAAVVGVLKNGFTSNDRPAINAATATLVARRAPLGRQWRTLVDVMMHNGEIELAIAAAEAFVVADNHSWSARVIQAGVLQQAGRIAQARAVVTEGSSNVCDQADVAYVRGTLDTLLGARSDAIEQLTLAALTSPSQGRYWLALAMAVGRDQASYALDQLQRLSHVAAVEPDAYWYARGKLLADLDRHDEAFAAFAMGAEIVKRRVSFSAAADERQALSVVLGYTNQIIEEIGGEINRKTNRSIIVTGNPRSGSTLVEQILTAHSQVDDGAELGLMRLVGMEMGGADITSLETYRRRSGGANGLTDIYLRGLDQFLPGSGRVVDKTLTASRILGIVAAILPEAPIVWMRRNALDNAWSCFRTYFAQGQEWSWSLSDIADHLRLEERLLSHWQSVLGDRLLVLDYEALVSGPAAVIPILLSHVGLPLEPSVYRPELNTRPVRTASVTQVRSPISAEAIGAATPYRHYLRPFLKAYHSV